MLGLLIIFRVCLISITIVASIAVGLIWGPVGAIIAEPIVRHYGENSAPALRIGSIYGSLFSGIILADVSLASGDHTLLNADRLMIRPSWRDLWRGELWLSDLEIGGMRTNAENLSILASRYGRRSENPDPSIKPIRVKLRDITFDTPMYQLEISEGLLTQDGAITLSANLGGLPVRVDGVLDFDPLQALSLDVSIGSGRASLEGRLMEPFDIKGGLHSIKLDELLAILPGFLKIHGDGEIEGRFHVTGAGEHVEAAGSLELKNGYFAGLPVNASTSWDFRDGVFSLTNTRMAAMSADVALQVSADLRPTPAADRFFARGTINGISVNNLQSVIPLGFNLAGDNGIVDFWVSADAAGNTAGKAFVRLPEVRMNGAQIVRGLRANAYLFPDRSMSLDSTGEVFGARISGTRNAAQGNENPAITFTASGVDSALLAAVFPALAPAAPSGRLDLNVRLAGSALGIEARSSTLSLAGVNLSDLSASARYENGLFTLGGLRGRIGNAPLNLAGTLNLVTSALRFDGGIKGFDSSSIPNLTGMTGLCDVTVAARGTMTSPEITVAVTGNNNTVMDIPLSRLDFSCIYANGRITIPDTTLPVPGGSLQFSGTVALPRGSEPVLDVTSTLRNLDLHALSQLWGVDMTGRASAAIALSGPVSNAAVSATVTSDAMTLLQADVRNLSLELSGTTENVEVRRLRANINDGTLEGRGGMTLGQRNRYLVDMKVSGLEIRDFLARHGINAGVGGYLNGELLLRGSLRRPELALEITSPLTFRETLVDRLSININSPARGRIEMEASGGMGDLDLTLKGHMERSDDGWAYFAESGMIDLNKLVSAKTPSMRGQISGRAGFRVAGNLRGRRGGETTPIGIIVSVPTASFFGIEVKDVSVPVIVSGGQVAIYQGTGMMYDGKVMFDADVDLSESRFEMSANVSGMDIGKAARPFLQGEIVGSADINLRGRGEFDALMMMFFTGDFRTGEGYIHEFDALKRIDDDGIVSFQEIRGSFFWDGSELWLNPGTQATAKPGDYLYRFLAASGSMGLRGRELGLDFNGNFNVEALNMLLGAMRGVFDLTTGSLTGGRQLVRQTVGRIVGLSDRDFQDVTFQLRGTWNRLQLLNLAINKSLEGFIPVRGDDRLPERRDSDRRIQFNLRIPTGRGSGDDGDAAEQFKRQLLDNLVNWTFDSEFSR